ncbi:hypothetical protein RCL1_007985 [Eukaryota sp. TZLM3-RCL]
MKPAVVVLCGSFNPPTLLHFEIIRSSCEILRSHDYFCTHAVISPVSNLYAKPGLLPFNHRVEMLKLGLHDLNLSDFISIDTWEGTQTTYTRSVFVLNHIAEQFPDNQIILICGADLVEQMGTSWPWDTLEPLLAKYKVLVFNRSDYNFENVLKDPKVSKLLEFKSSFIPGPLVESFPVSSTIVRSLVKSLDFSELRKFLTPSVVDYIQSNGLYS